jgi:S-adenosylmethionine:tRNA ribosyltransferase-isomerase
LDLAPFDYRLPEELIAQEPPAERDGARMLVLHRDSGTWEDRRFVDLPSYLRSGDAIVFNNSRVFRARLIGRREGYAGRVEVFLAEPMAKGWRALVRPGRKLPPGTVVQIAADLRIRILEVLEHGERLVEVISQNADAAIEQHGHVPLPPYIRRPDTAHDGERYQTIFAREKGSVAAPTAGLHFTPRVLAACEAAGARRVEVTLHVGLGTFQPLQSERVEDNQLHHESYSVSDAAAEEIQAASRVLAVGTTSVRTLESLVRLGPQGRTNLFIYPGFQFQRVDAMLTNFHLPKSSLLLLVSAFAGTDLIRAAYHHAVAERYRFFSYGDCMLIL